MLRNTVFTVTSSGRNFELGQFQHMGIVNRGAADLLYTSGQGGAGAVLLLRPGEAIVMDFISQKYAFFQSAGADISIQLATW